MLRPTLVCLSLLAASIAPVTLADPHGKPGRPAQAQSVQAALSQQRGLQVGDKIPPGSLHRITRPGLYGISTPPPGSQYGIVGDKLVRIDPRSGRVLSIIREVDEVLD